LAGSIDHCLPGSWLDGINPEEAKNIVEVRYYHMDAQ
jgi:hypothetical protein